MIGLLGIGLTLVPIALAAVGAGTTWGAGRYWAQLVKHNRWLL
ncbi:hypothetical protein [Prauserella flavalba]